MKQVQSAQALYAARHPITFNFRISSRAVIFAATYARRRPEAPTRGIGSVTQNLAQEQFRAI